MAKLLIFSDSHGSALNMREALQKNLADSDYILHLGDGAAEFRALAKEFPGKPFLAVAGNCDAPGMRDLPAVRTLEADGKKVLLCHGHTFWVKSGPDNLVRAARACGADVALYGHTHTPFCGYYSPQAEGEKPLWLFCPGSITLPAYGYPTFGIVTLGDSGVLLSHGEIH